MNGTRKINCAYRVEIEASCSIAMLTIYDSELQWDTDDIDLPR
jgi:hypothetical protein